MTTRKTRRRFVPFTATGFVELVRRSGHRPAGERGQIIGTLTNGAGRMLYAVRMGDGVTCDLPRRYIRPAA